KILMLCDFFGTQQTYQENLLAQHYIKLGHSVVVVTSTIDAVFDFIDNRYDKHKCESIETVDGIKIYRRKYSFNILYKLRKLRNVQKILVAEKPDLIFAHDIHLNIFEAVNYIKENET